MKFTLLFFIISLFCPAILSQPLIDKIQQLHLQKKEGKIIQYYSQGGEKTAESLGRVLNESPAYYKSNFGISEIFSIAVLDPSDWSKISEIPYGLPFVSGPPYVICFPSSAENELAHIIQESIADYNLSDYYSKSDNELTGLFTSMIGFHELGHIYAKKYGLNFPNRWSFEFAATYFAYLYLTDNYPLESEIWCRISEILAGEIKPQYTHLSDFENLYFRVGIENYAWYQVVFLLRVAETENISGKGFLKKLSDITLNPSDDDYSLNNLEKIGPGFIKWAEKYKLIE